MKITHKIHHSAANGFINSRTALKHLLIQENLEVSHLETDLKLTNFRELHNYPLFFTSLSHTKELGAAVLVKKSEAMGIGIDIEWADREIKPGAEKFFVNEKDKNDLSLIELWTAKEAAFKALSPIGTYPGTLVLSKIIVDGTSFYTLEEPHLVGNFTVCQRYVGGRKVVFTIASVRLA
jgi:phosphopantetheinyl transferase (holo-ACP synthase)